MYRLFMRVAMPFSGLVLARRLRRGKEHPARLNERRGEARIARPEGALVWLHGASVGELSAVFPLIERLRQQDLRILVTSGTVTSATLAKERLSRDVIHQFVPIDMTPYAEQFLDHWRPDLALFIESDLWPNLVLASGRARVPMLLVNGRLSERSFNRWKVLPRAAQALLRPFDLCLAQSALDAERFTALGVRRVQISGNLKLDVPAPPVNQDAFAALRAAIGGRPTIAAASTHAGEEAAMIDVHRRLRHAFPGLLTIIAPRHTQRGRGIYDMVEQVGLTPALRSQRQLPDRRTDIYIADTMGELGLLYRLAPVVFVGGSIVEHGGQNPIEAVKLGAAVLHGPNVWNFSEIYAALDAARGAVEVEDGEQLVTQIGALMRDGNARHNMVQAGAKTVNRLGGALERTLSYIEPYILQLRLDPRMRDA